MPFFYLLGLAGERIVIVLYLARGSGPTSWRRLQRLLARSAGQGGLASWATLRKAMIEEVLAPQLHSITSSPGRSPLVCGCASARRRENGPEDGLAPRLSPGSNPKDPFRSLQNPLSPIRRAPTSRVVAARLTPTGSFRRFLLLCASYPQEGPLTSVDLPTVPGLRMALCAFVPIEVSVRGRHFCHHGQTTLRTRIEELCMLPHARPLSPAPLGPPCLEAGAGQGCNMGENLKARHVA